MAYTSSYVVPALNIGGSIRVCADALHNATLRRRSRRRYVYKVKLVVRIVVSVACQAPRFDMVCSVSEFGGGLQVPVANGTGGVGGESVERQGCTVELRACTRVVRVARRKRTLI